MTGACRYQPYAQYVFACDSVNARGGRCKNGWSSKHTDRCKQGDQETGRIQIAVHSPEPKWKCKYHSMIQVAIKRKASDKGGSPFTQMWHVFALFLAYLVRPRRGPNSQPTDSKFDGWSSIWHTCVYAISCVAEMGTFQVILSTVSMIFFAIAVNLL